MKRLPARCGGRSARSLALLILAAVLTAAGCGRGGSAESASEPRLLVDGTVAGDLRALAQATWDRFITVFRARSDCFGDVRLHATYALEGRAGYDPDTATVSVEVPRTAAMLQSGLVHEWAHHLDYQCRKLEQLRPTFLVAQGLPADSPWRLEYEVEAVPADQWATIPAEQFAEATVELVLGGRTLPTVARVTDEAVGVIEAWAAGE